MSLFFPLTPPRGLPPNPLGDLGVDFGLQRWRQEKENR